jgi:AcrR family transcriptional regulator
MRYGTVPYRNVSDEQQPPTNRGGRPLDPGRAHAILQAALEGLAELGYDRLSMEEIATRARAGKGALYRRWPSKAALVVDAILAWRASRGPIEIPDTGSLRGDLDALIEAVPVLDDAARRQIGVISGIATAASRDPELREAIMDQVLARPRAMIGSVLDRAAARGEIVAGRDLELVPDVLIALNVLRLMFGGAADRAYVARVIDSIIYPLLTEGR